LSVNSLSFNSDILLRWFKNGYNPTSVNCRSKPKKKDEAVVKKNLNIGAIGYFDFGANDCRYLEILVAQTYHWRKWVVAEKDAFLAQTDISPISESTFALHRHILFILFICNYTFWVKIANTMNIKHLKLKYIWKSEQNPKRRRDPYLDTN